MKLTGKTNKNTASSLFLKHGYYFFVNIFFQNCLTNKSDLKTASLINNLKNVTDKP